MSAGKIFSVLVPPFDEDDHAKTLGCTEVTKQDKKLHRLLDDIFVNSQRECPTDITFISTTQQNPVRSDLLSHMKKPTKTTARVLARRLYECTTHRSGSGLLFVIVGESGQKIVVSRFPADSGILAEQQADSLDISFLERIFMKSAHAYKAAAWEDKNLAKGFWHGRAVDNQISGLGPTLSSYWVREFLKSEFRTTSAAGTLRLTNALKSLTSQGHPLDVKQKMGAIATLLPGLGGEKVSIRSIAERFSLPDDVSKLLANAVGSQSLFDEEFVFDTSEFLDNAPTRSVQLDNHVLLTGPTTDFDKHLESTPLANGRVRFTTEGRIIDERVTKRR